MAERETPAATKSMDDIMALCKRRGFIYQASEIYGGINGFWDYGPLGAQLKKNLRDAWWNDVVMVPCGGRRGPTGEPVRMVPVDSCIIQHPRVWEASGHVEGFNDPMVDDRETKARYRADHLMGVFVVWEVPKHDAQKTGAELMSALATLVEPQSSSPYPEFMVVAPHAAEALSSLAADPKQIPRLKRAQPINAVRGDGAALALLHFGERAFVARVGPVDLALLGREPERFPAPVTGKKGVLTPPRAFNLMFKMYVGATATEDDVAYLRPETAQGIFTNFKNVVDTMRVKMPFGIAQMGKAFRNEVTPRNFTFRSREFEQMEIEFFCHPSEARAWYGFWRDWRMQWWESVGLKGENLVLREHATDELAHYAREGAGTSDIEYRFPFTAPGYGELEGVAHRTDFDLRRHQEYSGVKLDYFDAERGERGPSGQPRGERYLPHVIEPSAGLDRGVLALLCEAFTPDPARASGVFLRFRPRMAPIKAAVYPLVNREAMPEVAARLHADLVGRFGRDGFIEFDAKQTIGKRYARMDEAGCPFCFTVDGQSLQDMTVTVRDRDTQQQERIGLDAVPAFLADRLAR
ncbi:MAG: glycine--tRNA ligase [Candidatus Rokubacteria bacterium]|nr:glycine--tRNA ligase [Candidatus Rokubacteria bacterium]